MEGFYFGKHPQIKRAGDKISGSFYFTLAGVNVAAPDYFRLHVLFHNNLSVMRCVAYLD
jgi:hypothetical protein